MNRKEVRYLEHLFMADWSQPIDYGRRNPMLVIRTHSVGIIKVEVFKENYLMECQEPFINTVLLTLLHHGHQVKVVGENHLIDVVRDNSLLQGEM